jgi:hypothetical protein
MSAEFDALKQQVSANTDAEASAVMLINGIATKLAGNPSPQEVNALASQLKASADALGAAVVANTPAA